MRSPAGLGLEPALYLAEDRSGGNRNLLFSGVIRSQEGDQGGSENKGCGGWAAYASHGAATYSGGLLPSSSVQQKKAAWHVPV